MGNTEKTTQAHEQPAENLLDIAESDGLNINITLQNADPSIYKPDISVQNAKHGNTFGDITTGQNRKHCQAAGPAGKQYGGPIRGMWLCCHCRGTNTNAATPQRCICGHYRGHCCTTLS